MNEREYQSVKESIRIEGLKEPIIVNSGGHIVDGEHRYKACIELAKTPIFEIVDYPDNLDIKRTKLYHSNEDNNHYKARLLKRALERQRKRKKAISLLKKTLDN